jgi:hypothetical protein
VTEVGATGVRSGEGRQAGSRLRTVTTHKIASRLARISEEDTVLFYRKYFSNTHILLLMQETATNVWWIFY